MTDPGASFPFEKQETGWMCGAASLCMAYRSLGLTVSQATIWAELAPRGPGDRSGVSMPRLGRDALRRGLSAVVYQTKQPWAALEACQEAGARVILSRPLAPGSVRRHFSVLVGLADDHVILYDPLFGPNQKMEKGAFLDSWAASHGNEKAIVRGLVAIADAAPGPSSCATCRTSIPEAVHCESCRATVPLRPGEALGCIVPSCPARLWRRLYCPSCDAALPPFPTFGPDESLADDAEDEMANAVVLRKLSSVLAQYQEQLSLAQDATPDSAMREHLGDLTARIKTAGDQLSGAYQKMNEDAEATIQRSRERMDAARRATAEAGREKVEALRRLQMKKLAKAQATAAKPSRKPIDPHLGAKLRDKLIEEFGSRADLGPPPAAGDAGSLLDYEPGG